MTNNHEATPAARRFRPRAALKLGVLLALGFVLATFMLGSSTTEAEAVSNFDQRIIDLTNQHRVSVGLPPLVQSENISAGSKSWSQEMASGPQASRYRHQSPLPSGIHGENIAWSAGTPGFNGNPGFSGAAGPLPSYCRNSMDFTTPEFFVCQWLDSPPHRSGMESTSHKQIGVGSKTKNEGGATWTFSTMRFSFNTPAPTASFTSPGHNARLCSGQKISWNGPSSGKYRLHLGTTFNGTQVMNKTTGALDMRAAILPTNRTIFAKLLYRPNGGSWTTVARRSFSPCANPVQLNTTNTLCSGDVISWSGPGTGRYKVRIGTRFDGTQGMNKGTNGRSISAAPNLPTGQDLHVTIRHRGSDGVWTLQDSAVFSPCSKPIQIISPNGNARLCDNDLVDWVGRSSGRYRLRIGTSPDGTNVFNESTYATKDNVGNLPNTSGTLYASLRHQTVAGGPWALHATQVFRSC